MIKYIEAIDQLPVEIKLPLIRAFELFKEEIAETVKRSDLERFERATEESFKKVWESIHELAEAQKRTEQRLEELAEAQKRTEQKLEELAEAQKRTEQKLEELAEAQKGSENRLTRLEQTVTELAEAQKGSENRLTRLEQTVTELAEAQKRTEQKLEELAEAQKGSENRLTRLEQTVTELAEAQKRTEKGLQALVGDHKSLRREVGGLSHTVGYYLEDQSYKALPELLRQDIGIEVVGRLKRDYVEIGKDRYIEVNIWGMARSDNKEYVVVGEAKTQLKKTDIDDFIKRAERLKRYVPKEQVRVLVTYHASPQVLKYARDKGIKVYFSYEL